MSPFQRLANIGFGGLLIAIGFLAALGGWFVVPEISLYSLVLILPGVYIIYWARSHPTTADDHSDNERDCITS